MTATIFSAGSVGEWRIDRIIPCVGATLPTAPRLSVGDAVPGAWSLRGVRSNLRYTTRTERTALDERSPPLARSQATCAALIPIQKCADWWALAQDERRAILEERSHHTAIGMDYLPRVARRLYHSRDLGEEFDFLTWFEFAPEDEAAFEHLLGRLRATEEWQHVTREVDIRLARDGST